MWDAIIFVLGKLAEAGLPALILGCVLIGVIAYFIFYAKRADSELAAANAATETAEKMADQIRDRMQEKYDVLLQKYNDAITASVRQTEAYIEGSKQMKELIVEIKMALAALKDFVLQYLGKK